jgi:sugar phosphate permease
MRAIFETIGDRGYLDIISVPVLTFGGAMEIRYTVAHAAFGAVFGAVVAHYFDAPWWSYGLVVPAVVALAYALSLWRLSSLDLKPDTAFLDYIEARKKRWR